MLTRQETRHCRAGDEERLGEIVVRHCSDWNTKEFGVSLGLRLLL